MTRPGRSRSTCRPRPRVPVQAHAAVRVPGSALGPDESSHGGRPGHGPVHVEAPMTARGSRWFATLISGSGRRRHSPTGTWTGSSGRSGSSRRRRSRPWPQERPTSRSKRCFGPGREIFVRFPAQVHTSPLPGRISSCSTPSRPPFDNVEVRRAINLALDRERVVQIFGGEGAALPTCQQLPPNFPGYEPYCPYTIEPRTGGRGLVDRPGPRGGPEDRPPFGHGRDAGRVRVPP